jgi:hypothetical protein
MKLPAVPTSETPAEPASTPPKTFWGSVLSLTPVVMTVLATILAGLSSSEMTQAMYHRSLASQHQSKANDQWSFFQAKRIRQVGLQETIDLLQALTDPGPVDPAALQAAADQLPRDVQQIVKEADQLLAAVAAAKADLGAAASRVQQAVTRLRQVATANLAKAEAAPSDLRRQLADPKLQNALSYLNSDQMPKADLQGIDMPEIKEAFRAVEDHQSETETASLLKRINDTMMHHAIERADANVLALERVNKPVSEALTGLEKLLQGQVQIARELQRAIRGVTAALAELPPATGKPLADVRAAADRVVHTGAALRSTLDDVVTDFKAARHDYSIRRYDAEAKSNQTTATIYEIQVRKSSATSEDHRRKSRDLFYGMLGAQAAVTIATFSLAVKYRSLLWGLATVAGLAALLFGAWVYLQ